MKNNILERGRTQFDYFKGCLKDAKYIGGLDLVHSFYYCVAEYNGKPVYGYLKESVYAGGALVLHKIESSYFNSFAGSPAESGHWIAFTNLTNGIVIREGKDILYPYWNKLVNCMISDSKKTAPAKWETTFEADFPDFSKAVITEKSVDFNGTTWGIAEFKKYALACRAIVTKHEKEYGKPN